MIIFFLKLPLPFFFFPLFPGRHSIVFKNMHPSHCCLLECCAVLCDSCAPFKAAAGRVNGVVHLNKRLRCSLLSLHKHKFSSECLCFLLYHFTIHLLINCAVVAGLRFLKVHVDCFKIIFALFMYHFFLVFLRFIHLLNCSAQYVEMQRLSIDFTYIAIQFIEMHTLFIEFTYTFDNLLKY